MGILRRPKKWGEMVPNPKQQQLQMMIVGTFLPHRPNSMAFLFNMFQRCFRSAETQPRTAQGLEDIASTWCLPVPGSYELFAFSGQRLTFHALFSFGRRCFQWVPIKK